MKSVLITAFEPYGGWKTNASVHCLESLQEMPSGLEVTKLIYPVHFAKVIERMPSDLAPDYDYALHLGQAPGRARISLEMIAINVGGEAEQEADDHLPICEDGPVGYRSSLPLTKWAKQARQQDLPVQVSHHAGTYLCNATLYWTHYFAEQQGLRTQSCFVHLPLAKEQVQDEKSNTPTLSTTIMMKTLYWLLGRLAE